MTKMEKIRAAVTARHGGFAAACDYQILLLWDSLDAATQKIYLDHLKNPCPEPVKETN